MEMKLICGYCGKKTGFPELSKDGKKAKCGVCNKWQTYKGTMEIK